MTDADASGRPSTRRLPTAGHGPGFWIVATTFLAVMAYSTVPTPLYPLYAVADGFPVPMITVIFAAYAVGVIISLYLLGHVSDWVGRRRMLVVAVLVSALSAVLFLLWPEVPGLIVARVINGASIGILTATATAHLSELRAAAKPDEDRIVASSISGVANLGGLALGPLIGGLFAEFLPDPLVLPHAVFLVLLLVAAAVLTCVPETVTPPDESPAYRPQRLSVPPASRSAFVIAGFAAFAGFAVFGLFTSLAPTFLGETFGQHDHLVAGATTFAVFAAAAGGQLVFGKLRLKVQLTIAAFACGAGLIAVAAGAIMPNIAAFIVGGVIAGLGVGVLFKGALATTISLADPARRGETLALLFLIAYAGLAVPVLAVGGALLFAPAIPVLLVFVALALVGTVSAAAALVRKERRDQ